MRQARQDLKAAVTAKKMKQWATFGAGLPQSRVVATLADLG